MSKKKMQLTAFWKKHQSLLQKCADLSQVPGVKVLCMITVPDEYSQIPPHQQHLLSIDESSVHLSNYDGTTVAFDSYSSIEERVRWNPLVKSVSRFNDPSKQFLADWNIRVSGKFSAVLGPDNISMYTTVDRRREPMKPVATHRSVTTEFDDEIMELKRHCASLESARPLKQPRHLSTAETLLSMNAPSSFADALCGKQSTLVPPENPSGREDGSSQSSEAPTVCMPNHTNTDEISAAVSALCAFGRMV